MDEKCQCKGVTTLIMSSKHWNMSMHRVWLIGYSLIPYLVEDVNPQQSEILVRIQYQQP